MLVPPFLEKVSQRFADLASGSRDNLHFQGIKDELASYLVEVFREISFCQQVASTLRRLKFAVAYMAAEDRFQIDERFQQWLQVELRSAVDERFQRLTEVSDRRPLTEPPEVQHVAIAYPFLLDALRKLIDQLGNGPVSQGLDAAAVMTALDEVLYQQESCL